MMLRFLRTSAVALLILPAALHARVNSDAAAFRAAAEHQHVANENLRMQNLWDGIDVYAGLIGCLGSYWTR